MFIRYEQPDETGETRRERNERFATSTPEFEIPEGGYYIWSWYHEISEGLARVQDGVCLPIQWTELLAWQQLTGATPNPDDFRALRAMDVAFCTVMNEELQAYQQRQHDLREAEMKARRGRK